MSAQLSRLSDVDRSVTRKVASQIRSAIVSGELAPRERISQEMGAQLGVSQSSVREALRQLESEGLVEHLPNRGVFVLDLSEEELLDVIIPTRVVLERYAIRKALARDARALLAGIEDVLAEMADAVEAGDLDAVNDADARFHEVAVMLCNQRHTRQLWRSILPRLHACFARLSPRVHALDEILEQHQRFLEVVRTGDLDAIDQHVQDHARDTVLELLNREPVPGALPPKRLATRTRQRGD